MHWATDYIGEEWTAVDNNCWSFVRRILAEKFGITAPEITADALNSLSCARELAENSERDSWRQVVEPMDGDAVLMGKSKVPVHIGIWVNNGILHCMQGPGVIYSNPDTLWATGLKVLGFYRRETKC